MLLNEFLTKYKIDPVKFSVDCEICPSSIYNILAGRTKPYQATAERIEKISDGLVTVRELRGKDDRDKIRQKRADGNNGAIQEIPRDPTSDI